MKFARLQTTTLGLFATASFGLAACSGGGGSAPTPFTANPPVASSTAAPPVAMKSSASKLGVTLAGASQVYALRHNLAIEGTAIAVAYDGATVAMGVLDKNGFAELTFTQAVPAGSTVVATIGTGADAIVASIVLASTIPATASLVIYNPGPPPAIHVASAEDQNGNGQFNANAPEEEEEDEDARTGQISIVLNNNNQTLPANLPIAVAVCGTTMTIGLNTMSSPSPSGHYALEVKERTHDDENRGEQDYHFEPFTSSVTIVAASNESRIQIELMQNGNEILKLKAPLSAFTPQTSTPTACPTASATAAPTATATALESPTATASATASASPSPMATASPTSAPY
jgi:hypothetical protein